VIVEIAQPPTSMRERLLLGMVISIFPFTLIFKAAFLDLCPHLFLRKIVEAVNFD
jgi:hypothetical protein